MKEFISSHYYYGMGEIIRNYSSFPQSIPLPISIQHGWSINTTEHDARKDVPENWYWSKDIEMMHKQKFWGIKTRSVGSPFLYLLKLISYEELPASLRTGSIVFPCHSSKYCVSSCDYELYANMLDRLPDLYKPITICVYHLDQEEENIKPFKDKGFEVVSNGYDLSDRSFLVNYIKNTKGKLFAFSNERSSALLYASAMGLKSFYFGPKVESLLMPDAPQNDTDNLKHLLEENGEWKQYFFYPYCNVDLQRAYCNKVLGEKHLLTEREMRIQLLRLIVTWRYAYLMLKRILRYMIEA